MRGDDQQQGAMYSYLSPEARVPQDHPLRAIRAMVDQVLGELSPEFDRLYVPRNDPRWLRRNALVAAGNLGTPDLAPVVAEHVHGDDLLLAETAEWALARIAERA